MKMFIKIFKKNFGSQREIRGNYNVDNYNKTFTLHRGRY